MRTSLVLSLLASSIVAHAASVDECPGYSASNVKKSTSSITADLTLRGAACDAYGYDIKNLKLKVKYETDEKLHVKIYDADEQVFQVPENLILAPSSSPSSSAISHQTRKTDLNFDLIEDPFSFTVTRRSTGDVLFNTSGPALIFESQYLRIRTTLPQDPNVYGLGENSDPWRHDPKNYSHPIWSQGENTLPEGQNLYGSYPVYYDHRSTKGTHAVFFHNLNGQRINMGIDSEGDYYLEWNAIGGVFDFYFLSGPTPKKASAQFADLVGYPAFMPYWSFGFHQCRWGMEDVYETAAVVANYSAAEIPLETMWNDIDIYDYKAIFTTDPLRYPLDKVRAMIDHLHENDQHYIMMLDPAVAVKDYAPYHDGMDGNVFTTTQNGSVYTPVVWAGASHYPDWFAPNTQEYWDKHIEQYFSADSGIDVDGLWIDMNEPTNFCTHPCPDPVKFAIENQWPPRPPAARISSPEPILGWPEEFQPTCFALVNFTVDATINGGDLLLLFGDAVSIGANEPYMAPAMLGTNGTFHLQVQFPENSKIEYSYPRYALGGTYFYETSNRTIQTGACGSTTTQVDHWSLVRSRQSLETRFESTQIQQANTQVHNHTTRAALGDKKGLPGRELLSPPYDIRPYYGTLSESTADTDMMHYGGLTHYDVHNTYASMMGAQTRHALIKRRPNRRPLIITRGNLVGDGKTMGHWFGDNLSDDRNYRASIRQMIQFAALYQLPMVGSDVCGFGLDTTEVLCARWAVLGSWNPFYRNHAATGTRRQEFYQWPSVAAAARKAINTRYRLLDYTYTAFWRQNQTGEPMISPVMWEYPHDKNTFAIDFQWFSGPALMVSPVTEPNSTTVSYYMPKDIFYDFDTLKKVRGQGQVVTRSNVALDEIPVHIKGGSIIPLRVKSAYTTKQLRKQDFELLIAPGNDGKAAGELYLDDGESITPKYTHLRFSFANNKLILKGKFGYDPKVKIAKVTVLGVTCKPRNVGAEFNAATQSITKTVHLPLTRDLTLDMALP